MDALFSFSTFISLVSPALIFAICLYYLIRTSKTDALFLSVGSGIALIMMAFFSLMPYYMQSAALDARTVSFYYSIGGIINLIGNIVFIIGLFMLVNRMVAAHKPVL